MFHHWHHPDSGYPAYRHGIPHYRHRRPSRFLWFVLGGATAIWFIKHKEMRSDERPFRFCHRVPIEAPPISQQGTTDDFFSPNSKKVNTRDRFDQTWNSWEQRKAQQWEDEKARLLAFGRQAGDSMTDLSETTLDSAISLVESLKAKLAEHRSQREQQLKDQSMEQTSKPRLV